MVVVEGEAMGWVLEAEIAAMFVSGRTRSK